MEEEAAHFSEGLVISLFQRGTISRRLQWICTTLKSLNFLLHSLFPVIWLAATSRNLFLGTTDETYCLPYFNTMASCKRQTINSNILATAMFIHLSRKMWGGIHIAHIILPRIVPNSDTTHFRPILIHPLVSILVSTWSISLTKFCMQLY
jgi:hypothetical protein